jgi:hypothetical protein
MSRDDVLKMCVLVFWLFEHGQESIANPVDFGIDVAL